MDEQADADKRKFVFDVTEKYWIVVEADNQDDALRKVARLSPKQRIAFITSREIKETTGL